MLALRSIANFTDSYHSRIQKLLITPLNDLTTISESELWSTSFNLMLSVLISDPDRLIHLRWTNTIPAAENGNSRSDTIISETPQMDFTSNVGFGEAKILYIIKTMEGNLCA